MSVRVVKDGIYMMVSGNFRCSHLSTKTFGHIKFKYKDEPFIRVIDNSEKWRRKIYSITSNAEYDIKLKKQGASA